MSLCHTPRFKTGWSPGEKKAEQRIRGDYLDAALDNFSGYIAADELYDGPFCVLSIVDNHTFRRLLYEVLDHDPDHADIKRFFRTFQAAIQTLFAPTPGDKRALQTVAKKIQDVLRDQDFFAFKVKTPTKGGKKADTIYQLKITLQGTKPPIWRRVQTKDCTLALLHEIIQVAMGWQFSHLYDFEVAGERYGDQQLIEDMEWESDRKMKLSQIVRAGHSRFTYLYDMGDNWEHTIQIEETFAAEPTLKYPRCIGGARACPPEDCGGVWGYVDFLKAVQNPRHKEHDEMLEWVGGEFDPEAFDADNVNKQLR